MWIYSWILLEGLGLCVMSDERGKIYNRERAKQLIDFSGLKFGTKTPTDIDGFLDFGNRIFVYLEFKYKGNELPYGQRLALERDCDSHLASGMPCYCIIATHEVDDTEKDIDAASSIVSEIRYKRKWYKTKEEMTVREAIEKICERHSWRE